LLDVEQKSHYLNLLKEHLGKKQRSNPQYSLRAYARDLEVHPSTLSAVLNGLRSLPYKDAQRVAKKLMLSPMEETLFVESLLRTKTRLDEIVIPRDQERFMLDESYYKVISEWEHYAVMALFDVIGFNATIPEVVERLKISETRAETVLNHLIACGLLVENQDGSLKRVHEQLRTTEDVKNQAIHQGHRDAMELGLRKLDEVAVDLRDFSEVVLAIDPEKMGEAKTIIREFRQKMSALMKKGEKTEVYQLAIQFYPLTTASSEKSKVAKKSKASKSGASK
jgi:uncharacterized protein (TIGR02147 family)